MRTVDGVLDLLLPRRCVLCRGPAPGLCPTCAASLPPAPDLAPPPGFGACWSLLDYDGPTRDLVAALKFDNHRDAVPWLAAAMAALVDRPVHTVTWAPTSAARRRRRGFDQSEVLARRIAAALGAPCLRVLDRTSSAAQTGHTRSERLTGPQFRCRRPPAGVLLVVDDVRTTGATLCAAGDALVLQGHAEVSGLTLAVRL